MPSSNFLKNTREREREEKTQFITTFYSRYFLGCKFQLRVLFYSDVFAKNKKNSPILKEDKKSEKKQLQTTF